MISKLVVFKHVYYTVLGYRAYCTMVIMNKDYVNTIKELSGSNVYIKDKKKVNEIINELVQAGINKLQIVLDFDKTVTKQHVNGVKQYSSFGKAFIPL